MDTVNYNLDTNPVALATLLILLKIALIFILIGYVLNAMKISKLFKKMGVPTWKAWVPIYNTYTTITQTVLGEGVGFITGLLLVLSLVPYLNWFVIGVFISLSLLSTVMIAKGFEKDWKWVLKTHIPIYGFFVEWCTYSKGTFNHEALANEPLLKKEQ